MGLRGVVTSFKSTYERRGGKVGKGGTESLQELTAAAEKQTFGASSGGSFNPMLHGHVIWQVPVVFADNCL